MGRRKFPSPMEGFLWIFGFSASQFSGSGKVMLSTFQLWQKPGFASEEVREIAPGCAQAWKAGKSV